MDDKAVFVKLDEFKDVVDILTLTRQKLDAVKGVLARIEEIEARERAMLDGWKSMVKDVEDRLDSVQAKLVR